VHPPHTFLLFLPAPSRRALIPHTMLAARLACLLRYFPGDRLKKCHGQTANNTPGNRKTALAAVWQAASQIYRSCWCGEFYAWEHPRQMLYFILCTFGRERSIFFIFNRRSDANLFSVRAVLSYRIFAAGEEFRPIKGPSLPERRWANCSPAHRRKSTTGVKEIDCTGDESFKRVRG